MGSFTLKQEVRSSKQLRVVSQRRSTQSLMGRPRIGDNDFNVLLLMLPVQQCACSLIAGNCHCGVAGSALGISDFKIALRNLLYRLDNLAIGISHTGTEI